MSRNERMLLISQRLSAKSLRALDRVAKRRDMTRSDAIREAIDQYLLLDGSKGYGQ